MQNQQWALSCVSNSLWIVLCDVCKSGQEIWLYRHLGAEMRNETTVGTCDVIPCLYTSAVPFLQLHGALIPSSGVDWGQPFHFREKKRNENQAGKKKITPGRFIRDFPGWRIFLAQSLTICAFPTVFSKTCHIFLKDREFGEEKRKGSAESLFLARLGARETRTAVMQWVPLMSMNHYSNTGCRPEPAAWEKLGHRLHALPQVVGNSEQRSQRCPVTAGPSSVACNNWVWPGLGNHGSASVVLKTTSILFQS